MALPLPVVAAGPAAASGDVPSVFFVAKSENRNQVHYGVHVDANCAPSGAAPAFAYWRMFEHGPTATEPMLAHEVRAYGFAAQRVIERDENGGRVLVLLAALPNRPLLIETRAVGSGCKATATISIGGVAAYLGNVYLRLRWPFGVESMTLTGRSRDDGRILTERIAP
jgi:hypothetical protein